MNLMFRSMIGALCALTLACSKSPELSKISGYTQGTTYNLTFELPADTNIPLSRIEQEVEEELALIDIGLSNYRDDSVIEKFNANISTEVLETNAEMVELIEVSRKVHRASNGCYDLTIKPLFDLWGFKKDVFHHPSDTEIQLTLASVGLDNLETIDATHLRKKIPHLRVDVSSIAQGYTVERIVKLLARYGVHNYLVEVGGELKAQGKKPNGEAWRIALEKPLPNERKMHKIVSFDSGAPMSLIASGTYRHFFDSEGKRYSHILDARTGKPIEHETVSVTVMHPDPTIGEAWSTALLCLGSSEGIKIANAEDLAVLFIDQHGDELIESQSEALRTLTDISLNLP
jgi:thiamine biosynthesis lipoprotein